MAKKIIEDSGVVTFVIKCEYCLCKFEYNQEDIGYRLWYPHGFVYCPKCGKPLRHNTDNKKSTIIIDAEEVK